MIPPEVSSGQCGGCCAIPALQQEKRAVQEEEVVVSAGTESGSVRMEAQAVSSDTQVTAPRGSVTADAEEAASHIPGKTDSPCKRKGRVHTLIFNTFSFAKLWFTNNDDIIICF